jgi:hypothetical protein
VPILIAFLLGISNFALHRAVLESGHPLLDRSTWAIGKPGGRFSLALEFAALLAAMLAIGHGSTGWAWAYGAYSVTNAVSAWLILTRRI